MDRGRHRVCDWCLLDQWPAKSTLRHLSTDCPRGPDGTTWVNVEHLRLCASAEWAALVRDELLPWVLGDAELGDDVLELGAGLVTDLLVERAPRITAVEIDTADATVLPLTGDRFCSAVCFTGIAECCDRANF